MEEIKFAEDASLRDRLFAIGARALEQQGWTVRKVPPRTKGSGKGSVRQIVKGSETKLVCIRTTRDRHIAFPRNPDNTGWSSLEDVDLVCAVSTDKYEQPEEGSAHLIDQKEMVKRFDRAFQARIKAGHAIGPGIGMWLSLYRKEANEPGLVGAGVARPENYPAILTARLWNDGEQRQEQVEPSSVEDIKEMASEQPLTIAEAKRRLALSLGIDEACIKISIEA